MANGAVFQQDLLVPAEALRLPAKLIRAVKFIAKSAVVAVLLPLPKVITSQSIYIHWVFYTALLMLFLFGVGMIVLNWFVSDDPAYYGAMGRAVIRASDLMLVFAEVLREIANNNN